MGEGINAQLHETQEEQWTVVRRAHCATRAVCQVLLLIGNTMNAYSGSSTGTVQAFKIDSLFQVSQGRNH